MQCVPKPISRTGIVSLQTGGGASRRGPHNQKLEAIGQEVGENGYSYPALPAAVCIRFTEYSNCPHTSRLPSGA